MKPITKAIRAERRAQAEARAAARAARTTEQQLARLNAGNYHAGAERARLAAQIAQAQPKPEEPKPPVEHGLKAKERRKREGKGRS